MIATVESLKCTWAERRRIQTYQPGDMLSFHGAAGLFPKHALLTVIGREEHLLVVQDAEGREHRMDPRHVSGFDLGTARTIPVAVGDRLLLRDNLKQEGLRNGDIVEVAGFLPDGGMALKDGRILPAWFREFAHGYAATSHASQGKTVDHGILFMAGDGIGAGNLKQAYVSNSRFRESQTIYTTDKQAAREAMMLPSDRKLALEMIGKEKLNPSPAPISWLTHRTQRIPAATSRPAG